MGQDCTTCCTTAEENKQEINDENEKIAPSYNYKTGITAKRIDSQV